jgi:hypothetical protein
VEQEVRVVLHGSHVELVNGSDTVRVRLEIEAPEPDSSEAAPSPGTPDAQGEGA